LGREQWYTLYTKPNAEYQVAASLQEREVQTYLPEIELPKAPHKRRRKPFFPCYLFIKVDLETTGLLRVQWTPGLRYILAFDGRPVSLPDRVIDLIRRKLNETNATGRFRPGDAVRISGGPLQGMEAIFEGPSTPAERVRVLLTILGHASRVHISAADLEKALPVAEVPSSERSRRTRGRGRRIKSRK
jgi:transcriptional antiterminator RfaH